MGGTAAPERLDQSFAALRSLMGQHRGSVAFATALRAVAAALPALHPYLFAQLATSIDDPERAGRFLLAMFATGFGHMVLWSAADFFMVARVIPLTYEFKRRAFETVWSEDYQRFVDRPSGKVASFVNDIRNHSQALWEASHFGFVPILATIPIYVVLLWQSAVESALVYGLFLLVAGALLTTVSKPVNHRQRHLTNNTATNTGRVFDSFSNFVNVFSFRAQDKEIARNDDQLDGLIDDDIRFGYALSSYWGVASLMIRGLLWAAVMGFSWLQFDRGQISFTVMIVSITVLLDFTNQYWNVVYNVGQWIDKAAAYREAYTYLFPGHNIFDPAQQPAAGVPTPVPTPAPSAAARIEARRVSFAYPDDPERLVLDGVDLSVGPTDRIGIVGRSGEGKSTLIKLLLGFYQPTSGEILLDGAAASAHDLSDRCSYVPQDTSLFQETIEYNIGYAQPGPVDPEAVRDAAHRANIADFIETLPDGYRTLVGERGIKLSLGQRQRIAIARAFLRSSDIIILDEATSALDSETERQIQSALDDLWQGRAAVIVAHRLATLRDVDRILVIERGRVVEEGSRKALLANPGRFAEMWGLQRDGFA